MPREALPWLRWYCEAIWDRKLRRLNPEHRWLWVVVLSCARQSSMPGVLLIADQPMDVHDLADAANLPTSVVDDGMRAFTTLQMVTVDGGCWTVTNFLARQPLDSTERSRRSRSNADAAASQRGSNANGTASESDLDADIPSLISELASPPSDVENPGSEGGVDLSEVWDQIARWNLEARQAGNGDPVRNPDGWLVRAREKAERDYGAQVPDLLTMFVIDSPRLMAELLTGRRAKTYVTKRAS